MENLLLGVVEELEDVFKGVPEEFPQRYVE